MVSKPLEINCGLAKKNKWKHKYPLISGDQKKTPEDNL